MTDPAAALAPGGPDARSAELRAALARVEQRIVDACAAAGRDRGDVTLIVVTKTFPAADLRALAGLGVREVGENRMQEVIAKAQQGAFEGLRLHLIGQLQTNKAAEAARFAGLVHSLDRLKLARALGRGRESSGIGAPLPVLIQISLDGDPARGGVPVSELGELTHGILQEPGLDLAGVMAVPPRGSDPAAAFAELARIADGVRAQVPGARIISAGMSADLEAAVAAGATHLRVGSAILGSRPSLR